MTLPTTNVSFSAIQTEFGGSNPISLSEYYLSGTYVRSNTTMPNGTIASSGAISVGTFRGATQGVLAATYAFGTIPTSINEGSAGTFNVTTTNVADSTTLYWTIATNAGDFATSSGSFTITSNAGSFTVTPAADATTEVTAETFTVSIRTGSIAGTVVATSSAVTINDTSQTPAATYAFGTIPTSINEGSAGTFNVTTTNVADSTTLYWTIATNAGDFSTTSGSFTITSNAGSFTVTPTADATTEVTAETFTVAIRTGSTSGTVQATSSAVTINDTSQTPAATYSLTRSVASVNEGGSFTITFATNQAGSFAYTITGVISADIGSASLTGTVSNGDVLSYNVTADTTTEGTETFTIALDNGLATRSVTINDTSTTPAPTPPSSATWSVGFSNDGTAGPISTFINVVLNRAATVSTSYTFTGIVVENSVTFPCPTVTIPIGSTSPAVVPNAYSGIVNGAGSYVPITLRVTPVTVPYPLTPSTRIDTSFQYSN